MKLEQVLPFFKLGSKIQRRNWSPHNYMVLSNPHIECNENEIKNLCMMDILAEDWIILNINLQEDQE